MSTLIVNVWLDKTSRGCKAPGCRALCDSVDTGSLGWWNNTGWYLWLVKPAIVRARKSSHGSHNAGHIPWLNEPLLTTSPHLIFVTLLIDLCLLVKKWNTMFDDGMPGGLLLSLISPSRLQVLDKFQLHSLKSFDSTCTSSQQCFSPPTACLPPTEAVIKELLDWMIVRHSH